MSGSEPLAVLGIAFNLVQVLSFGHETNSTCKRYYREGSADPAAREPKNTWSATRR